MQIHGLSLRILMHVVWCILRVFQGWCMDLHAFINSSMHAWFLRERCIQGFPWKIDLQDHDACINLCLIMVIHGSCAHGFPWNLQCSGVSMEQRYHGFPGKKLSGFAMEYMPRISQGSCGLCRLDFPGNQAYRMYLKTKCFIIGLQ